MREKGDNVLALEKGKNLMTIRGLPRRGNVVWVSCLDAGYCGALMQNRKAQA